MNRPIRRVAVVVGILILALLVNLNYQQVVKSDAYRSDPANRRVLLDEYDRQRGSITAGGVSLADSVATGDRLKYLRKYPGGQVYAPVTGFYSPDYGDDGMEAVEDSVLSGNDDRLFTTRFTDLITGRDPRGGNVVLTIDRSVQQAAFNAMAKQTGAVVALDPTTGAILAAVSTPSYDPSTITTHSPDANEKAYAALTKASSQPMLNRAFNQLYPPGSVFKVVVAATALQDGKTSQTTVPSPDSITLPGTTTTLQNFEGENCGGSTSTIDAALIVSCNTAFANLGMQLGTDKLRSEAARFGINDKTSAVPLKVAASTVGPIVDQAALAQSSIGQRDVRITPLQGAMIAAAVSNNGTLMKPYLISEEQTPSLATLSRTKPSQLGTILDPGADQQLKQMMVDVVNKGTGTAAQISGVEVGGKTGTADTGETSDSGEAPDAWFVGFGSDNGKQIAVAVLIEHGGVNGNEATGGLAAGPVARAVMQAYLGAAR